MNLKEIKMLKHILKENHIIKEYYKQFDFYNKDLKQYNAYSMINMVTWSYIDYEKCSLCNCSWNYILGFTNSVPFDKNPFIDRLKFGSYMPSLATCQNRESFEKWIKIFYNIKKYADE